VTHCWVGLNFFLFFIFKKFNLKLRVDLEFYKSFRGIKVILPLLPSNLMPNPNRIGTLHQIRSLRDEIESF